MVWICLSLRLMHFFKQFITITVHDDYCNDATSKIIQFAQTPTPEGVGKALSLSLWDHKDYGMVYSEP